MQRVPHELYPQFELRVHDLRHPEFAQAVSKAMLNLPWLIRAGWSAIRDDIVLARPEDFPAKKDWIRKDFAGLPGSGGSFEAGFEKIQESKRVFTEAKTLLESIRTRAGKNAHNIDFWLEGIDCNLLYTDFLIHTIEGSLREEAAGLLERLESLRDATRALLSETYLPLGMEYDIGRRYGR